MSVIKNPDLTDPNFKKPSFTAPQTKKPDLLKRTNENEEMGYKYYGPKPAWCYGYFSTIGSNWFFM